MQDAIHDPQVPHFPPVIVSDGLGGMEATNVAYHVSSKRPRTEKSRVGAAYARKRAVAACQLCRTRKVKCNNARPACSNCEASSSPCTYEDRRDHSAFDPASILILDRLDQVLSKLDRSSENSRSPPGRSPAGIPQRETNVPPTPHCTGLDRLEIPSGQTTAESILRWPILADRFASDHILNRIFEAEDPSGNRSAHELTGLNPGGGIDQDSIPRLVNSFLDYVHNKNPILDVESLLQSAQRVSEEGVGWDAESCLVLIACALGCVALPFSEDIFSPGQNSLERNSTMIRSGNRFYNLARRRIGILDDSLLSAQCYFLAGVYLMHIMRPLAAWSHFNSASKSYHMHLQFQAHRCPELQDSSTTSQQRRLEQSLYWSCYKSECELRVEISVPQSSLAELALPDMHPLPPHMQDDNATTFTSSPESIRTVQSPRKGFNVKQQEDGWYYYLTEITFRRISNSIYHTFFDGDYTNWTKEQIPYMIRAAADFEQQLDEWYIGLPTPIKFDEDEFPFEELPYMVRSRLLEMRTWIYQPFLYHAIHNASESLIPEMVMPLAKKALHASFQFIKDEPIPYRHHGAWLGIRTSIAASFQILATAQSESIPLRFDWKDLVRDYIDRLNYWKKEISWIPYAIEIIESYVQGPESRID